VPSYAYIHAGMYKLYVISVYLFKLQSTQDPRATHRTLCGRSKKKGPSPKIPPDEIYEYTYMHIWITMNVYKCSVYGYVYSYQYVLKYMCICIDMYKCIRICMQICIHTHALPYLLFCYSDPHPYPCLRMTAWYSHYRFLHT
jgi:hypothetical protein